MSDINALGVSHLSDEATEEYVMGRVPEDRLGPLEEHLLVCEHCRRKVEKEEEYRGVIRAALQKVPRKAPAAAWRRSPRPRKLMWLAPAIALALSLMLWNPRTAVKPGTAEVLLYSMRADVTATAPSGRPLVLYMDASALPATIGAARVKVVDASGGEVSDSPANLEGARCTARIDRVLPAGRYWVRLYNGEGSLVREYGLKIQ